MAKSALKDRPREDGRPVEGDMTGFIFHGGKKMRCLARDVSENRLRIQTFQEIQHPAHSVLRMAGYEVALVVVACKPDGEKTGQYTLELKTALPEFNLVEIFTMGGWLEHDGALSIKRVS